MGEKEGHDIHRLPFVKSIKLRRDRKVAECSSHGDRFCSLLSKYEIKSFFLSLVPNLNFETECLARYCASPGICHVAALRRRRRRFRSFCFLTRNNTISNRLCCGALDCFIDRVRCAQVKKGEASVNYSWDFGARDK